MKFNQLERAVIVASAAVFLLATADGIGMTWLCPVSGPGSCSERLATDPQTLLPAVPVGWSRRPSGDQVSLLEPCRWDERVPDEQVASSTATLPPASPSQQGIPCPVEAKGHFTKLTSRIDVLGENAESTAERTSSEESCTFCGP